MNRAAILLLPLLLCACSNQPSEDELALQIKTLREAVELLKRANLREIGQIELNIQEEGNRARDLEIFRKMGKMLSALDADKLEEVRSIRNELPVLRNELDFNLYEQCLSNFQENENELNDLHLRFHREKLKGDVLGLVGQMFGAHSWFGLTVDIQGSTYGDSSTIVLQPELWANGEGIKIFYDVIQITSKEIVIPHDYRPIGNLAHIAFPSEANTSYQITAKVSGKNELTIDSLIQFGKKEWVYMRK